MFQNSNHGRVSGHPNGSQRLLLNKKALGLITQRQSAELTNSDNTFKAGQFGFDRSNGETDKSSSGKSSGLPIIDIRCDGLQNANKIKFNGPYKRTFPRKFKETVVKDTDILGIAATAKKYNITRKNVERWCRNGIDRKPGGGRKTHDMELENNMIDWVEAYIRIEKKIPRRNYIIVKASQYVNAKFKASKGWCDKFLRRNKSKFAEFLIIQQFIKWYIFEYRKCLLIMTKTILVFGASISSNSINQQLAQYASSLLQDVEVRIIQLIDYSVRFIHLKRKLKAYGLK